MLIRLSTCVIRQCLALAAAALLVGGCGRGEMSFAGGAGGGWIAATGLARAEDPAMAAAEAAELARSRLNGARVRAAIFFDCFGHVDSPPAVAQAVAAAFPGAAVIGCSAAGVAVRDASGADRAVAVLAIGGEAAGCRFTVGYAPGGPGTSSSAAAGELMRQLGRPAGADSLVLLLASPAAIEQANWDPADLLAGLTADCDGPTVVFGGLASPRGPRGDVRLYASGPTAGRPAAIEDQAGSELTVTARPSAQTPGEAQPGAAAAAGARPGAAGASGGVLAPLAASGGVAALQICGPLTWASDARQELLRVGPVWTARQVSGAVVGQLTSGGETLSAEGAIGRVLIAQERADGHLGRLVGERVVPLRFAPAANGGVRLATRIAPEERMVILRSGPAQGRLSAARAGLAETALASAGENPAGIMSLPSGPGDGYVEELAAVQQMLSQPGGGPSRRPAAIVFMGPGQFAPVANLEGRAECYFHQHSTATLQFSRRR